MATALVEPGSCKLKSKIVVTRKNEERGDYTVQIHIESESDNVKRLAEKLTEVDGFEECFKKISTSEVYRLSEKVGLHLSCPVPSAILKTIEVECGLNLPQDVKMVITRD
ncbi:MAG: hypothetical protein GX127_09695 [Eubacteriaceae bacterium]|nr:hypothetical protein [Eubacteriaceae bacterium]